MRARHGLLSSGAQLAAWLALGLLVLLASCSTASGREIDIVRVEEDWELIVAVPIPADVVPQITTTMSPNADLGELRAMFTLNLLNRPRRSSGGMQLQLWSGQTPVTTARSRLGTRLRYANERITWTQVMSLQQGRLRFAIVDGESQTWGAFGGQGNLAVEIETGLTNLNQYYHGVSAVNSGVSGATLAPTRVRSLTLGTIRQYSRRRLVSQSTMRTLVFAY